MGGAGEQVTNRTKGIRQADSRAFLCLPACGGQTHYEVPPLDMVSSVIHDPGSSVCWAGKTYANSEETDGKSELFRAKIGQDFADRRREFETVPGKSCREPDILVFRMAIQNEVFVRGHGVEASRSTSHT